MRYVPVQCIFLHDLILLVICVIYLGRFFFFKITMNIFLGLAVPWKGGPSLLLLALQWVGRFTCRHKTNPCCPWIRSPRESVKFWWLTQPARVPEDKCTAEENKEKCKVRKKKNETRRREVEILLWMAQQKTLLSFLCLVKKFTETSA